jgi:transposase InsO family protein
VFPSQASIQDAVSVQWLPETNARAIMKQARRDAGRSPDVVTAGRALAQAAARRQILWLGVTAHPTAEWISRQLTEAYGWKVTPRYIIRDRDAVYGDVFIRRLRAMSIRDRPTAPRSPWQNGYCERGIGSIRRECLDHVVVFGERHLRHLLRARTHLSVNKDAPSPRTVHAVEGTRSGKHNRHDRHRLGEDRVLSVPAA